MPFAAGSRLLPLALSHALVFCGRAQHASHLNFVARPKVKKDWVAGPLVPLSEPQLLVGELAAPVEARTETQCNRRWPRRDLQCPTEATIQEPRTPRC